MLGTVILLLTVIWVAIVYFGLVGGESSAESTPTSKTEQTPDQGAGTVRSGKEKPQTPLEKPERPPKKMAAGRRPSGVVVNPERYYELKRWLSDGAEAGRRPSGVVINPKRYYELKRWLSDEAEDEQDEDGEPSPTTDEGAREMLLSNAQLDEQDEDGEPSPTTDEGAREMLLSNAQLGMERKMKWIGQEPREVVIPDKEESDFASDGEDAFDW